MSKVRVRLNVPVPGQAIRNFVLLARDPFGEQGAISGGNKGGELPCPNQFDVLVLRVFRAERFLVWSLWLSLCEVRSGEPSQGGGAISQGEEARFPRRVFLNKCQPDAHYARNEF